MDLLSGDEKTSDWISCKAVGVKESRVGEGQAMKRIPENFSLMLDFVCH